MFDLVDKHPFDTMCPEKQKELGYKMLLLLKMTFMYDSAILISDLRSIESLSNYKDLQYSEN
jgi:hypothetical protein